YFDTVVNGYLISSGALDIEKSPVIGLVVETQCRYFKPITFPDAVHAGLRVARLGKSSVRYEIGIFRNDEETAAAQGHFVHVYVDRENRRPATLPPVVREATRAATTVASSSSSASSSCVKAPGSSLSMSNWPTIRPSSWMRTTSSE